MEVEQLPSLCLWGNGTGRGERLFYSEDEDPRGVNDPDQFEKPHFSQKTREMGHPQVLPWRSEPPAQVGYHGY